MSKSQSKRQSSGHQDETAQKNAQPSVSNSQVNERLLSNNSTGKHKIPAAKTDLQQIPVMTKFIPTPKGLVEAKLSLGGSLTAKPEGSTNPTTISKSGIAVDGKNGSTEMGYDGSIKTKLASTLNGVTSSMDIKLSTPPSVNFGHIGNFGSVEAEVRGNKVTYKCTSKDIKKVINGIELSGNLSYTLELTLTPNSWQKQLINNLVSITEFIGENLEKYLLGGIVFAALATVTFFEIVVFSPV